MFRVGVGTKLRRLLALLDGDVQQLYAEAGSAFRPKYYPVVVALLEHGELDVLSLAAASQVTQPAMTQTLQGMADAGLIRLMPGRDRRQRIVALTSEGRAAVEALAPIWGAVARAAAALDAELSSGLETLLDEAILALERKPFRKRIEEELR